MFAARPGSAVNGYALPFAAAAVADLLAAASAVLAAAAGPGTARGFLGRRPAALATFCAFGCATRKAYRPARPAGAGMAALEWRALEWPRWNVSGSG
jgi:hypothetical protein